MGAAIGAAAGTFVLGSCKTSSKTSSKAGAKAAGSKPVTEKEVKECQAKWANAIKTISSTYLSEGDFIGAAADAANELYGYGKSEVLFKPVSYTHLTLPTNREV